MTDTSTNLRTERRRSKTNVPARGLTELGNRLVKTRTRSLLPRGISFLVAVKRTLPFGTVRALLQAELLSRAHVRPAPKWAVPDTSCLLWFSSLMRLPRNISCELAIAFY